MTDFDLINKAVFFPEEQILAVGDLHIGYETSLRQSGISIPKNQIKDTIDDFKKIFKELNSKNQKPKKVIFLGDIKHYFGFEKEEFFGFKELLEFLKKHVPEKNIILIKGNHDKFNFVKNFPLKNYYIEKDLAFAHGHKSFPELFDKKVKTVVVSHIHPAVKLSDKPGIKKEKFRCFLTGKYKNKEFIIVPHFFNYSEGTDVRETHSLPNFFIIPRKSLGNFNVHVIGEKEILSFGKVKEIR